MDQKILFLSQYFASNGSLADVVAFTQMVAAGAWGEIAKLFNVIQGSV